MTSFYSLPLADHMFSGASCPRSGPTSYFTLYTYTFLKIWMELRPRRELWAALLALSWAGWASAWCVYNYGPEPIHVADATTY